MTHPSKAVRFVRRDDRPATNLEGDLVFLDAEHGEYQVLRGTARLVWDLLARPRTLDELCAALTAKYDVPASRCHEQLSSFLDEMTQRRLVSVHPE